MPDRADVQQWADLFAMLGDPSRLRLLLLIHREGPISVGDLSERTALKPTTVSHALRVLRFHGMVDTTRDGRSRYYRLSDDVTAALLDHLPRPAAPASTKAMDPEE